MVSGRSVVFKMDSKYLIPTAERKARRLRHSQHLHSERCFKNIPAVPIGRPKDVELKYDIPYRIEREVRNNELSLPRPLTLKQRRRRAWLVLVAALLALWVVLANIK